MDIAHERGGLLRIILAIYDNNNRNKNPPLSTWDLLNVVKSTHGGKATIRKAEKMGYIKRQKVKRIKGEKNNNPVGKPPILHSLTPKGKVLAKHLAAIRAL